MSLKTQAHQITLAECFNNLDEKRKHDAQTLLTLFSKATKEEAVVWGKDIIGFGSYRYKHHAGNSDEWPLTGFSPRKAKLSIYIMPGFEHPKIATLLSQLGKHSLGKSCLYITQLANVDLNVLAQIISESVLIMKQTYPQN
jgi:hypothetical protein